MDSPGVVAAEIESAAFAAVIAAEDSTGVVESADMGAETILGIVAAVAALVRLVSNGRSAIGGSNPWTGPALFIGP
jgi:hypothetical protein